MLPIFIGLAVLFLLDDEDDFFTESKKNAQKPLAKETSPDKVTPDEEKPKPAKKVKTEQEV